LVKKIFAFFTQTLRAFAARTQWCIERQMAKQIEWIGVRLFCCFC